MTDTPALEPCPWCGEDVELMRLGNESASVECFGDTCGASGPTCETRSAAAQAWNEVAEAARKWKEAEKVEQPDQIPDRPICSTTGCDLPAEWRAGYPTVLACDVHKGNQGFRHDAYVAITPPTPPMTTDQPTAFEIRPGAYVATPKEVAVSPSIVLSADGDRIHFFDEDGDETIFPSSAIPALIDALQRLQDNE